MWNVNMKYPPVIIPPVDHSSWRTATRTAVSWATLALRLSERDELHMSYVLLGMHGGVWIVTLCSLLGVYQRFG
jgi:hypothetical protein